MTFPHLANIQDPAALAKDWSGFLQTANDGNEWLYMIIDAAQDERIFSALKKSSHTRCCLFNEDEVSIAVKSVAPFLVKIKSIDDFIMWCLEEGLHRNWMIFFTSAEIHVSELKLHFKRFFVAHTPDGKQYFFRYYDPRILPAFLTANDQRGRADFFRRCSLVWVPQISAAGNIQFLQLEAKETTQVVNIPVRCFS